MKNLFVVAVALFNEKNQLLLAQRPAGKNLAGFWEFPGGKIEQDESPEDAIVRELSEELNITLSKTDLVPVTFASHTYEQFQLVMPLFLCKKWTGTLKCMENQQFDWVDLYASNLFETHPPAPADIRLINFLKKFYKIL